MLFGKTSFRALVVGLAAVAAVAALPLASADLPAYNLLEVAESGTDKCNPNTIDVTCVYEYDDEEYDCTLWANNYCWGDLLTLAALDA